LWYIVLVVEAGRHARSAPFSRSAAPLGRRIGPQKQTKSQEREPLRSRDVKNDDRPDYVYENKGYHDKMSTAIAEILHKFMHVLQKSAHWQGQFAGESRFRGCKPSASNQSAPLSADWGEVVLSIDKCLPMIYMKINEIAVKWGHKQSPSP
jgi:hypothetical protein